MRRHFWPYREKGKSSRNFNNQWSAPPWNPKISTRTRGKGALFWEFERIVAAFLWILEASHSGKYTSPQRACIFLASLWSQTVLDLPKCVDKQHEQFNQLYIMSCKYLSFLTTIKYSYSYNQFWFFENRVTLGFTNSIMHLNYITMFLKHNELTKNSDCLRSCPSISRNSHCGFLQCSYGEKTPISADNPPIHFVVHKINSQGTVHECK